MQPQVGKICAWVAAAWVVSTAAGLAKADEPLAAPPLDTPMGPGATTEPPAAAAELSPAPAPGPRAATPQQLPAPPKKYEMRFQFNLTGAPSLHTFVLKWNGPDSNLQTIEVLISDNNAKVQTIAVPQDRVHVIWKDVEDHEGAIKDSFFDSADYNFDKYADLRLLRQFPYKVGEKYYLIWLYNEDKNQYELSEALSALPAPAADAKRRRVTSVTLGGFAGSEFSERAYSVSTAGKIRLEERTNQSLLDKQKLLFQRDVRRRVHGNLERICTIWLPTEGRPKLKWGHRATCAPYMKKGTPAR